MDRVERFDRASLNFMAEYDFANLSGYEFELLVRDLFSAEFQIRFQSFKPGKDQGIDLLYDEGNFKPTLVQCKQYAGSSYSKLTAELRREVVKIQKFVPLRYIVATTLPLSLHQKKELVTLLGTVCNSVEDIFGQADINQILEKHPAVHNGHFKLWLRSFEVIEGVVNRALVAMSQAEQRRIERKAKIYVANSSFLEAKNILEEFGYCVIAGPPGIGKTTTAEMLLIDYARLGYEVVKISSDIGEGFQRLKPKVKQVFYYDDFLGQTGLKDRDKLVKNEDDRILLFIEEMQHSHESRFILTTREFVLAQVRENYERIKRHHFEQCVIQPGSYTEFERAQILYNHLYFSDLPAAYKLAILNDRAYLKIANHDNFFPRLIETMTQVSKLNDKPPERYVSAFISFLDNPQEVWHHTFSNLISPAARNLLLVLATLPKEIFCNDLEKAFRAFHKGVSAESKVAISNDFKTALRECEATFLNLEKADSELVISFQNPSIRDFLENELTSNMVACIELCQASVFFEQVEWLASPHMYDVRRKEIRAFVWAKPEILANAFDRCWLTKGCSVYDSYFYFSSGSRHTRGKKKAESFSSRKRVVLILKVAEAQPSNVLKKLVSDKLALEFSDMIEGDIDREGVLWLCEALKGSKISYDYSPNEFFARAKRFLVREPEDMDDWKNLVDFIESFRDLFSSREMLEFGRGFIEFFGTGGVLTDFDAFEDHHSYASSISEVLNLGLEAKLQVLLEEYESDKDDSVDRGARERQEVQVSKAGPDSIAEIDSMFSSLKNSIA